MPSEAALIILGKMVVYAVALAFILYVCYMMFISIAMISGMIEELRYSIKVGSIKKRIRKIKFIFRRIFIK